MTFLGGEHCPARRLMLFLLPGTWGVSTNSSRILPQADRCREERWQGRGNPRVAMRQPLFNLIYKHLPSGYQWMLFLELKHPESEQTKPKPGIDASHEWACHHISSWGRKSSISSGSLAEGLLKKIFFFLHKWKHCIFILIYI